MIELLPANRCRPVAVVSLLLCLSLSGCGSGGGSTAVSADAVTAAPPAATPAAVAQSPAAAKPVSDTPQSADAGQAGSGAGTGTSTEPTRPKTDNTQAVKLNQVRDPWFENLDIAADAHLRGMWVGGIDWPLIALHASLMPDGKVLTFGAPIGEVVQAGRVFDFWEPGFGRATDAHFTIANAQGVDSFCATASFTTTGRLLVAGGNAPREGTFIDPVDKTVSRAPTMGSDRWYGSLITLADGRQLMTGGADYFLADAWLNPNAYDDGVAADINDGVAMTPEVLTAGQGWRRLEGATSREAFGPDLNRYWYPRNWVAPDGKVFGLTTDQMWRLDPDADNGNGRIELLGKFKETVNESTRPNVGATSSAVMFDVGRILQTGGNGYRNGANYPGDVNFTHVSSSSRAATVIELGDGSLPTLHETAPMNEPRQWHNATVLPDGQVFVNGGTRLANYGGADAVHDGEIWSPLTGQWQRTAAAATVRVYHSTSLLLPNGTVLTAGGGAPGPVNNFNAELFLPPYLFQRDDGRTVLAARPQLLSLSSTWAHYGQPLLAQVGIGDAIKVAALIGLGNDTHSFNPSQRRVPLTFSQVGDLITLQMPSWGAIAPPGYYQLVVLNARNVPSRGAIIRLQDN